MNVEEPNKNQDASSSKTMSYPSKGVMNFWRTKKKIHFLKIHQTRNEYFILKHHSIHISLVITCDQVTTNESKYFIQFLTFVKNSLQINLHFIMLTKETFYLSLTKTIY